MVPETFIDREYAYSGQGSHEPLARVDRAAPGEADEVLYYHTDVNGAPEEMTDGGGNIVWEAGYQVWGNLTHEKETRPVQQNLRFQGQYLDRETGLHYNLYRFYDPDIGKFISGDPISIRGGINLYQYAPNPLSWIDPLGLAGCNAQQRRNISDLRNGKDVTVRSIDEARALLDKMPDLRPHVDNFPARSGELYIGTKFSDVWKQPAGTYRGDLYNVKNPLSNVVHNSKNPLHDNNPHYNIIFGDGTKAGIIIVP
nr:RHS repeat-associated core domain-containing protein [Salmonella enterica]